MYKRQHTILTPHEGEFRRLFGEQIAGMKDKVLKCIEAAKIAGSIILLKGADTIIASPDGEIVINSSEAPYLATAGSGDVLAGIISSLVGKNKMRAFDAACAGAYIHSKMGELIGQGLIAEDIIQNIPCMMHQLLTLLPNPCIFQLILNILKKILKKKKLKI